jgi:hypothetical protein
MIDYSRHISDPRTDLTALTMVDECQLRQTTAPFCFMVHSIPFLGLSVHSQLRAGINAAISHDLKDKT